MLHIKDSTKLTDQYVHYDGPFLIGSHTLCGWTDIIGSNFEETTKRVNCAGCLSVIDHVKGTTR